MPMKYLLNIRIVLIPFDSSEKRVNNKRTDAVPRLIVDLLDEVFGKGRWAE